jgi:hypothetical protein
MKTKSKKLIYKDTAAEFGCKVARIMLDLKSSHCYFILQQAYGNYLSWEDAEILMEHLIASATEQANCGYCGKPL